MDVSHLIDPLNSAQREAVSAAFGHRLVLAGAGSGKTRVLVHRIAWLLEVEGASPWSILSVTFTNKAAGEMRARADALIQTQSRGLWIGTFHGIAHRLLRQHWQEAGLPETFQILDSDDQLRMVKRVTADLNLDDTRYPPRQSCWFINAAKDDCKRPKDLPNHDIQTRTLREIYEQYEARCKQSGLVDFAELLLRVYEMLRDKPAMLEHYQKRFTHILVDEFQDTNTIQYAWLKLLAGKTAFVYVVGDDDQAIYGWRGAQVENVQHFLRDFPQAQTSRLEQNYRSTATILEAANAIIANNPDRLGKTLFTQGDKGAPIDVYAAYNEQDEARYVIERVKKWIKQGRKAAECAILYRSNAQSRLFEEACLIERIPYRVYGGQRFFDRMEIKDTLAYLRLIAARNDDAAFERAVNTPTRGIGERTLDILRTAARDQQLPLWEATLSLLMSDGINGRAKSALSGFVTLINQLAQDCVNKVLAEQFSWVIDRVGLRAHYLNDSKGQGESRGENLDELVNAASRFVLMAEDEAAGMSELTAFLSHAALESGENEAEAWEDCLQLMTLHSAKGLEFPQVFLVGLEDGLFPSQKSVDHASRLEEERRLAYVGITRARESLVLCYAESRRMYGSETHNRPSRFLTELPKELLQEVRTKVQVARPYAAARNSLVEAPAQGLKLGQRVQHKSFGAGTIVDYEGGGAHARVQVNFEDSGSKWLVVAYANLLPA